ncbi:MAG: DsrE family protein [Gammaproteobacteria bacterium]|nr:DsrE family protein [Gammaproteobacteria bacterium]MDH5659901.1 DsrE family protein [Gammaproteobacteria bacterium]
MPHKFLQIITLILSSLFFTQVTHAMDNNEQIKEILSLQEAPAGIVFEIVTGESNSLEWALPETQSYIKELRARFPELDIAIVTHGNEQFALKTSNDKKYKKVHSLTQQLVQSENVPLHVCGTYASWKGVGEEEFPDYVDVTAAGPATINDYVALGYILIKIE